MLRRRARNVQLQEALLRWIVEINRVIRRGGIKTLGLYRTQRRLRLATARQFFQQV